MPTDGLVSHTSSSDLVSAILDPVVMVEEEVAVEVEVLLSKSVSRNRFNTRQGLVRK